jgi:flagellar biosynthetic protein FliR
MGEVMTALASSAWLSHFALILSRLTPVIMLMPGIGESVIPLQFRVLVLLGLSLGVASMLPITDGLPDNAGGLSMLIFREIMIGAAFGSSLRLCIWILSIAGSIIAQAIGISQFLGVAMDNEAQPILSNLLSMAGAALLLSANIHVQAVASIVALYEAIPAGSAFAIPADEYMRSFHAVLGYAVLLSWPFVVANLAYNICLGFINRAMPSLMVAFVGAPFMTGGGLLLLLAAYASILNVWSGQAMQLLDWL